MTALTLKSCIKAAADLNIKIYGDTGYRGYCAKEDADLASFFSWVRFNYPEYHDLIFHPETEMPVNGGASYAYHAKSKAKGRLDGVADIICLPISKNAPVFACELKRRDISKSLASRHRKEHFNIQLMRLSSQKKCGAFASVALGIEAAKAAFIEYVDKHKDKQK